MAKLKFASENKAFESEWGKFLYMGFALKKKSCYICDTFARRYKFGRWCNWQHVWFWSRRVQVRALVGQHKFTNLCQGGFKAPLYRVLTCFTSLFFAVGVGTLLLQCFYVMVSPSLKVILNRQTRRTASTMNKIG